jgi:hypothetical protein
VIRIGLDASAAMRTRFAISPLGQVTNLMVALADDPASVPASWRARFASVVRERNLRALASLAPYRGYCYAPDFLEPRPGHSVDEGLHDIATTPAHRIRRELDILRVGCPGIPPRRTPPALDPGGEAQFAERVAAEIHQLWTGAFAPCWPQLRTRLERDIAHRAGIAAAQGLAAAIESAGSELTCDSGVVTVGKAKASPPLDRDAQGLVLAPALFSRQPGVSFDLTIPSHARPPVIYYPARQERVSSAPRGLPAELVGDTRARLLAELRQPPSTTELAGLLHLTPATVSYHLQILHRAGAVRRSRQAHRVLYAANI